MHLLEAFDSQSLRCYGRILGYLHLKPFIPSSKTHPIHFFIYIKTSLCVRYDARHALTAYTPAKAPPPESSHKGQPLPRSLDTRTRPNYTPAGDLPSTVLEALAEDPTTARPLEEPLSRTFKGCVTPAWALMWLAESSRALHKGYKDNYKKYDGGMWITETWASSLATISVDVLSYL